MAEGPNSKAHVMPQFKKEGGPHKLPDVPIQNLPAGGTGATHTMRPHAKGVQLKEHRSTATVSRRAKDVG